jgi:hypothetical protein
MEVRLRRPSEEYRVGPAWWVALTGLAIDYGWSPSPASWSDRDEANCELILDRVTDADAHALADALERALPDIPGHDALSNHPRRGLVGEGGPAGRFLSKPPSLFEWFSGPNKQWVRGLIRFARRGGFRVEDPSL